MRYIFPASIFTGGVVAAYIAIIYLTSKKKKRIENRLFTFICLGSAIWSIGFAALFLQNDVDYAFVCRAIGMVGVFLYLISAQMLICQIADIEKKYKYIMNGVALTGIIVYFMVTRKSQIIFKESPLGMTYHFTQGLSNNIYTLYSVCLAINFLIVTIYMIKCSNKKRIKAFGRKFLIVEIFVVMGMILDTVLPLLGIKAIPGSTLTQFWALMVLYYATLEIGRSYINIENMSEFIYYSLSVPVLLYDTDKRLHIVNDAAVDFFECDRETLKRENISISEFFDIDENQIFSVDEKIKKVDAICRNNQAYCSLRINKIEDNFGDIIGYIIIVNDISERMKNMEDLREAVREADAANRAKSAFLANMSHEIRTPMNAIIGFSELALTEEISPVVKDYVTDIKTASHNLLAIINDILDISKIESGKMELVCSEYYSRTLFDDVFLIVDGQAKKKGLKFNMNVSSNMPAKMYGDKVRIRGILINLLNNAVKYTNEGYVSLNASVISRVDDNVKLEFKVSDTGVGIKKEDQKELFEKFSQVDKTVNYGKEGTGLGLAIVKGFVTLMEGDVSVESRYGAGSTFTVTIQQKAIAYEKMNRDYSDGGVVAEESGLGDMKINNASVLIVDDNRVNLKMASKSMEHYGLDVDIADSGAKAIEMCRIKKYAIVFMDQMMPQMNGIEAMKEIRKTDDHYRIGGQGKIVILTANTVSGMREQLMNEGFDEFLGKPMNFRQLERIFKKFIPDYIKDTEG